MITPFSFLMGIIWCNLFATVLVLLRKSKKFISSFGAYSLTALIVLTLFRMFIPIELPFVHVVEVTKGFPEFQNFLLESMWVTQPWLPSLSIFQIFIILWFAVALVLLVKYAIWEYLQRRKCFRQKDNPAIIIALENVKKHMKMDDKVHIRYAENISCPAVYGYFRPTICFPVHSDYTEDQLFYILNHELCHFKQKDPLVWLLLQILMRLLWWNYPFFAWVLRLPKCIRDIQEIKCDATVMKSLQSMEKLEYILTIKNILLYEHRKSLATKTSVKLDVEIVKERFEIVSKQLDRKKKDIMVANGIILATMVIFFFFSYTFVVQPDFQIPEQVTNVVYFSEDVYFYSNEDGTYDLYVNDVFQSTVTKDKMNAMIALEENYE